MKKIIILIGCIVTQHISSFSFHTITSFFRTQDTLLNMQRAQYYTGAVAFWMGGYALENDKCMKIGASLMAGPLLAAGLGLRCKDSSQNPARVRNLMWMATVPASIFAIKKFYEN